MCGYQHAQPLLHLPVCLHHVLASVLVSTTKCIRHEGSLHADMAKQGQARVLCEANISQEAAADRATSAGVDEAKKLVGTARFNQSASWQGVS